jgi:hypothetical protein
MKEGVFIFHSVRSFLTHVFHQDEHSLHSSDILSFLAEGIRFQFLLRSCMFDRIRY